MNKSKNNDFPKNYEEMKELRKRELGLEFSREFIDRKITNKSEFCKKNHISHHTLNKSLNILGIKICRKVYKNEPELTKESKNKPKIEESKINKKYKNKMGGSSDYESVLKDIEEMNKNI